MTANITRAAAARAGFYGARVNAMEKVGEVFLLRLGMLAQDDCGMFQSGDGGSSTPSTKPFSFAPGQWVDYYVPECDSVGGFSIVSSPDDLPNRLDLAIKFSSNSKVAQFIHHHQQVGDMVYLRSGGNVSWDAVSDPASSLLLAGGIGITPFLSMCSHLQNNIVKTNSRIALVHSARRPEINAYWPHHDLDQLKGNQLMVDKVFTDGTGEGRIKEASIERALSFLRGEKGNENDAPEGPVRPFVCGPEGFVSAASSLLVDKFGFCEEDLMIEKWW